MYFCLSESSAGHMLALNNGGEAVAGHAGLLVGEAVVVAVAREGADAIAKVAEVARANYALKHGCGGFGQ